jgi:hypothetical protein
MSCPPAIIRWEEDAVPELCVGFGGRCCEVTYRAARMSDGGTYPLCEACEAMVNAGEMTIPPGDE